MSKDTKIVSVQLTLEQVALIDARAQATPFSGNRSKYLTHLFVEDSSATSHILEQAENAQQQVLAVHDEYEQQINMLNKQIQNLTAEVAQLGHLLINEQSAHQRTQQQQFKDTLGLSLDKARLEFNQEDLLKRLASSQSIVHELQDQNRQLIGQHAEEKQGLVRQMEQLKGELAPFKSAEGWSQFVNRTIRTGVESIPGLKENFEQEGLWGLLRGRPTPKLDQALSTDFPGAALTSIKNVLRFLKHRPAELTRLLASEAFKAYQMSSTSSTTGSSAKPGSKGPDPTGSGNNAKK